MTALVEQVDELTGWPNKTGQRRQAAGQPGKMESDGLLPRHRRSALLNRVVEAEILPRLALARAGGGTDASDRIAAPAESIVTTADDTHHLVRLLLGNDDVAPLTWLEQLAGRGASPTALYLGVITHAARRLGDLWEEDRCDFAQVTISLGRLQQIVRSLSPSFQVAGVSKSAHSETIQLLPAPGEQHTFGLVILAEFFQREGWHVTGSPVSTGYDAADLVRNSWVDVAGFSIGSASHIEALATCIRAIRRSSRNPHLGVIIGGPLYLRHPELVNRVGADTGAIDAPSAVRQARGLLVIRAATG